MEHGSLERTIEIAASPETVYEVITRPEHLKEWWPDDAELEAEPGAIGHLVFGDRASGDAYVPELTVVDADPPRLFSFLWNYPEGSVAEKHGSLFVRFELSAHGSGTLLHMVESGFREMGWEIALLEERYRNHGEGWDHFLGRLVAYAPTVAVES